MKRKILLATPVYNEESVLEPSIRELYGYMAGNIRDDWEIVIIDNASTDSTGRIADELAERLPHIKAVHLTYKGRGNALKETWSKMTADIYAYCDIDLSTDPNGLKELFQAVSDGYDIAVGTRYIQGSTRRRTLKRLVLSKAYIFLIKIFFKTNISDFQCGFKAVGRRIVEKLIPKVESKGWFFDTELLLRAEKDGGYRIREIPVTWHENPKTKVKIGNTVYEFVTSLIELKGKMG